MGVVNYLTVEGEILSETRNGIDSDYIPDPLGSTAKLVTAGGVVTDTFLWWPYGEVRSRFGSNPTPIQRQGSLAHYTDSSGVYAVAGFYLPNLAARATVASDFRLEAEYRRLSQTKPPTGPKSPPSAGPDCGCLGRQGKPIRVPPGAKNRQCYQNVCNTYCRMMADSFWIMQHSCSGFIPGCIVINSTLDPCSPTSAYYGDCHTSGGNGAGQLAGSACCVECQIRVCCWQTAPLEHLAALEKAYGLQKCLWAK